MKKKPTEANRPLIFLRFWRSHEYSLRGRTSPGPTSTLFQRPSSTFSALDTGRFIHEAVRMDAFKAAGFTVPQYRFFSVALSSVPQTIGQPADTSPPTTGVPRQALTKRLLREGQ